MNLKTTLSAAVSLICKMAGIFLPGFETVCLPLGAVADFLVGFFAKDANPL